ncbi:MAG: divalent-cation tolerance protein CutA [Methylococcales bacterium]|nr:divalent-cation tolerance protein CutA [Methylococcales bacterium]
MPSPYQLIFCTCPDKATAEKLAYLLVSAKLVACANLLPGITSIYRWQGEINTSQEHLLLLKANKDRFGPIADLIKNQHPYELPEIIAVPIENGLPEYLHWIDSCH